MRSGNLEQLAALLRRRFARTSRSFVVLVADRWWAHQNRTDDMATQKMPVMRIF